MTPERLVIPVPLIVKNRNVGFALMEKLGAPGLNTISSTSVSLEIETFVAEDEPNVAVSAGPLGTVVGDQLAAVFQSPLAGDADQVALPAKAGPAADNRRTTNR